MPRIVLLVSSPRLPAGLLTAAAWDLLRAHPVRAAAGTELAAAAGGAGATVEIGPASVDELIAGAAEHGTVVWLAGPAGDPDLARELGLRLAREPGLAELELVYGSWDPPGARLLDAVTVIDRLVSPGGDPWKRSQTHASLAQYLLEEAYEAYDAIEAGDLAALREEIGDVLLQVLLHARLAEELPADQRWTVDDVAADFVAKMVRRNPHVFAGVDVADVDEIVVNWERIKRDEKARESALDGIPMAQPALSLAAKVLARAERAGLAVAPPAAPAAVDTSDAGALGVALLGIVAAARGAGVDAEAALRRATLAHAETVRDAEQSAGPGGVADPPAMAQRLARERNAWICTLRPDGSPHVTPVWFIYRGGTWWIGSDERSVKARNIGADPRVSLALEDAAAPVVAEGRARIRRDFPAEIVTAFAGKYSGWDVTVPYAGRGRLLFEVPVDRWLLAGTAQ